MSMRDEVHKTERRRQEVEAIKKVVRSEHKGRGASLPGLLACRWASGYSQQELAERAGIARTTIRALECGERRAHATTLRRISEALAVSPADLLTAEVA